MFKRNKKPTKFQIDRRHVLDIITLSLMVFGVLALVSLIYFQVRPIKFADIKVPVATDKASYYPSQEVSAIFFGETFYDGEVKTLREVFCKNYREIILPPENAADGNYYQSGGKPRKLNGDTLTIGKLPATVPIGSNCIIQFTGIYEINTPFGTRTETYKYYTQNFSIVSKDARDAIDQRNEIDSEEQQEQLQSSANDGAVSIGGGDGENTNQDSNTTTKSSGQNNTTPSSPSTSEQDESRRSQELVQGEATCNVNIIGLIKLGCN